jgi:hypothetical protein
LRFQHSGKIPPSTHCIVALAGLLAKPIKSNTNCFSLQSESVLIQKIFTHFKKAPGTHKLGVLYVVDSVTRKWLEQAKAQAQAIDSSAPDGTYAAGVNRVTELMPVLMNDILQSAPKEQKVRIFDNYPCSWQFASAIYRASWTTLQSALTGIHLAS